MRNVRYNSSYSFINLDDDTIKPWTNSAKRQRQRQYKTSQAHIEGLESQTALDGACLPHLRVASSFSTARSLSCTPVMTARMGATLENWNSPDANTVASDVFISPEAPTPDPADPRLMPGLIREMAVTVLERDRGG